MMNGGVQVRGFKIDENGDIVSGAANDILTEGGKQIQMVEGGELIAQKILIVLGTNIGEWFWNEDFGIDFDYIIGKGITEDMIRAQIESGLSQVDKSLYLSTIDVRIDKSTRTASVDFTVASSGENIVKVEKAYGAEQQTADLESKLATANTKVTVYETSIKKLANRLSGLTS